MLFAAVPAVAERDRTLLDRHRPVLRYDAAERFFAQPVSLPPGTAEVVEGNRVYGHVVRDGSATWLQYWLFYAYNPQDREPLATGRHEGDWELVQVRLLAGGAPQRASLSQHSWAEGCRWEELERTASGAPIVYVANGSHANYSRAGEYDRPFPDPTDEAGGDGVEVRPRVTLIRNGDPAWVRSTVRWGGTEAGFIPGEMSSPVGPRFQDSGAWGDPAALDAEARACGSGPPSRPLQTAITLALLTGAVAFTIVAVRRRMSDRRRVRQPEAD